MAISSSSTGWRDQLAVPTDAAVTPHRWPRITEQCRRSGAVQPEKSENPCATILGSLSGAAMIQRLKRRPESVAPSAAHASKRNPPILEPSRYSDHPCAARHLSNAACRVPPIAIASANPNAGDRSIIWLTGPRFLAPRQEQTGEQQSRGDQKCHRF